MNTQPIELKIELNTASIDEVEQEFARIRPLFAAIRLDKEISREHRTAALRQVLLEWAKSVFWPFLKAGGLKGQNPTWECRCEFNGSYAGISHPPKLKGKAIMQISIGGTSAPLGVFDEKIHLEHACRAYDMLCLHFFPYRKLAIRFPLVRSINGSVEAAADDLINNEPFHREIFRLELKLLEAGLIVPHSLVARRVCTKRAVEDSTHQILSEIRELKQQLAELPDLLRNLTQYLQNERTNP